MKEKIPVNILKRFILCILWQDIERPRGKAIFLTFLYWIVDLFIAFGIILLLRESDLNSILKTVLGIYLVSGSLTMGAVNSITIDGDGFLFSILSAFYGQIYLIKYIFNS